MSLFLNLVDLILLIALPYIRFLFNLRIALVVSISKILVSMLNFIGLFWKVVNAISRQVKAIYLERLTVLAGKYSNVDV